jgi:signal transduction histidine kinase
MGAEVLGRIFEPLFSARKKGQGAGLGLSQVYGIVKRHDGWVEVKSEPGRGSEFTVFLPA